MSFSLFLFKKMVFVIFCISIYEVINMQIKSRKMPAEMQILESLNGRVQLSPEIGRQLRNMREGLALVNGDWIRRWKVCQTV